MLRNLSLFFIAIILMAGCSTTKQATVPTSWKTYVNWADYNSAEVTSTDHVIVQNETDILMWDGETGQVLMEEVEDKGMFAELGSQLKESALGPLSSKNDVGIKYWHRTLPGSQTLLLFDRSTDAGTIRSIDLQTGKDLWSSEELPWNVEKFRDETNFAVRKLADISLGAAAVTGLSAALLMQNRAVESIVKEIPQRNAFLFRTLDGVLHMIDSRNGDIIWQNEDVSSTGMATIQYLEETDEVLIAGDMAGLKDIFQSADAEETMKQIYRINAEDGEIIWETKYKGREDQIADIKKEDDKVLLYFTGGSLEFFDFEDGTRKFGTRDEMGMGVTKFASAVTGQNSTLETVLTSMPIIEGNMVYAVNPTGEVNAFALDNKQLVKYNYETGEEIWKSPVLEKAVDVRNMTVTDKLVIVTIPGAGNVVGGTKDPGVYAFDKETGDIAWQFTDPFSKNYSSNVVYGSTDLVTGDGNLVYRIDMADGEVITEQSFEEPDIGDISVVRELPGDTTMAVVGSKGVSVIRNEDFSPVYNAMVDGQISSHQLNDKLFIGRASKTLSKTSEFYAFDLRNQQSVANFTLGSVEGQVYGNLALQGYMPVNQMQQVLTIDNSGITSYDL